MDPITIGLIIAGIMFLGFNVFTRIRATASLPVEQRITALLAYAPQVVAAASQIFKLLDAKDKDEVNANRKNYAMTLMLALARQFNIPVSDDLTTLISSAIEAAVRMSKK